MAVIHEQPIEIIIPQSVIHMITRHVIHKLPQEVCGVLQGTTAAGGIRIEHFVPVRNVAPDPLHHFELDPRAWVQLSLSERLIGVVHSHPVSDPVPSAVDLHHLPSFASMIQVYMICAPDAAPTQLRINTYLVETNVHGAGRPQLKPVSLSIA